MLPGGRQRLFSNPARAMPNTGSCAPCEAQTHEIGPRALAPVLIEFLPHEPHISSHRRTGSPAQQLHICAPRARDRWQ